MEKKREIKPHCEIKPNSWGMPILIETPEGDCCGLIKNSVLKPRWRKVTERDLFYRIHWEQG